MLNLTDVHTQVETQFPEFYSEFGPSFIAFVEVYYKWMKEENLNTSEIGFLDVLDIDKTPDGFLEFFRKQYMVNVPNEILGNQRLLQKHILDIYRSKGSIDGLKVLFQLLYNEKPKLYLPRDDIFTTSSGDWTIDQYFEIENKEINSSLEGKVINGEISGATAYVQAYSQIIYNGRKNFVLYLSNISGTFTLYERIYSDYSELKNSPKILGSVSKVGVTFSNNGFSKGDVVWDEDDERLRFTITNVDPNTVAGVLSPSIVNQGSGYTTEFTETALVKRDVGHPGSDAEFVPVITPTGTLSLSPILIAPYANTNLNAADYGMNANITTDSTTILEDTLSYSDYDVGFISSINTLNDGTGYENIADIEFVDTVVSTLGFVDEDDDTILGNNALGIANPSFGSNRATEISVQDSLLGYNNGDPINLTDGIKSVVGNLVLAPIGHTAGYYKDRNGFLSDNKFLIDSNYYQDFSYDIRSTIPFNKYENILKKIHHPVGSRMFGNYISENESETTNKISSSMSFTEV